MSSESTTYTRQKDDAGVSLGKVALLALGPAVALGWARFAYGFLLPAMQKNLSWSYGQAGVLNTGEAAGYLLGALLTDRIVRVLGIRRTFNGGMVVVIIGLLSCAFTTNLVMLVVLRTITGFGAATIFIGGASLVATGSGDQAQASRSLATYTSGVGLGIIITALAIPYILSILGTSGWQWGWVLLAGLSFFSLLIVQPALHHFPDVKPPKKKQNWIDFSPLKKLVPITLAYTLMGMSYVGYMTFYIAFLHQHGVANAQIPGLWVILGSLVIIASFIWGRIFHHMQGGKGFALVLFIFITGILLPLIQASMIFFILSAVLVGASAMAGPPAVFHFARKKLDPQNLTSAISGLTICFGIGQAIGPVLIGAVSDIQGSVGAGLLLSAAIMTLALIAALFQKESAIHLK